MQSEASEFMTVAEYAAIMRVTERTVRNAIDSGDLAIVPVGKVGVRIPRAVLTPILRAEQKSA